VLRFEHGITGGKDRRRYEYNKGMPNEVDAVYENSRIDVDFVEGLRRRLANAEPAPGLEEVRRRLSKIPGSMTADFIADREDR